IFREVHTWSKLRHKHVVHMLGISTEFDSTVSIISEWMPLGNARDYVGNTANDPRPLLEDIASALCYLHNHVSPPGPIVHGDLKGANVLVSSNCRALLSDFGLSILNTSTFNMTVDTPCGGTLDWMASELLDCKPASKPSDVWAFGMTILELFTRSRPFQDCQSQVQVMSRISTGKLPPRPTEELTQFRLSDAWWEICTSCWTSDPLSRPAISDVIEKVKAAMINNTVKHPRPAPEDSLGPVNTLALATIPAPATPLAPADMPVSTNTIVPGDIHIPAPANPEGPLPTTKNQTTESKVIVSSLS
ncbi:kinase-like domain-containing protein, partial [Pisolithus croceorrhizus]